MPIHHGFPDRIPELATFMTIGNFDGVHRGHQALITAMVEAAHDAGCLAAALTFDPHPLAIVRPELTPNYLTTAQERADLLSALGLDYVIVLRFTQTVAATSATDFMRGLVERMRLRTLWVGPDFALGRGREGTPERLAAIGSGMGFTVRVLPPFDLRDEPVRSTTIRSLLKETGAVERAAELLGRPYQVEGPVQHGARRGRALNYPTANLGVPPDRVLPAFGIYACWAWHGEGGYPAAVSIGVRPTFDNGAPTVEAHLLDYAGDLYDETLSLSFISRLRGEQRFPDAAALVAQMDADVAATRAILSNPPDDAGTPGEGWEELDHTADWSIRVTGATQAQLFARAAQGMYALQDAALETPITLARTISVDAENPAELMVGWLNRLLLAQELGHEMYTRFSIHVLSATGLRAVAYGYSGQPLHTAIKAVTFYDLDVRQEPDGWHATVTFDV